MKNNFHSILYLITFCTVFIPHTLHGAFDLRANRSLVNLVRPKPNGTILSVYEKADVDNIAAQINKNITAIRINQASFSKKIDLEATRKDLTTFVRTLVTDENRKVLRAIKNAPHELLKEDVIQELKKEILAELKQQLEEEREAEELFDDEDNE